MIGEAIGNFRVRSLLGRGGMGEVYLAENATIGTKVAIKFLLPEISEQADQVQRFFNEARAVSAIKHAGTVKIFDVGFHKTGHAYLIMEFLEGESLGDRIRRGRLTTLAACDIGRQIASVLDATHEVGVIHRDLKPDNIYLVHDREFASGERVKILDFGIAKLGGSLAGAGPRTIGTIGTPTYMAPEQWGDSAAVDWRADAYSLGCVAYEMLAGSPPFDGQTIAEFYKKHISEAVPPLHSMGVEVPHELETLIHELLAKNPNQRPATMRKVVRSFETIAAAAQLRGPFDSTLRPEMRARSPSAESAPKLQAHHASPSTGSTTLDRAASESRALPVRSQLVLPVMLVAAIVTVIGLTIFVATRKHHETAQTSVVDAGNLIAVTPTRPPPPVDAAVVTFREWEATANPFVAANGIEVLDHQVTRGEYARYLADLSPADRTSATPLQDWSDADPGRPVSWITAEQAQHFCAALGAKLPTVQQWTKAAGTGWGIDVGNRGAPGPLQEWTSTEIHQGFVVVAGANYKMTTKERESALASPYEKPTQKVAGPSANARVADPLVGMRCARP